ncbi:MAG: phosphotransferase, partial [Halobacteriovoraceae bacterium]|nr:phosphotransferase [Halobacteriovoraceae bacterium]
MGVYSDINLNEINEILSYYELGQASDYERTITGISNSNFQVKLESGNSILLKISNDKTLEQLENEQNILLKLKEYHFEYSLPPCKTILGKPIYHHNNFYGVVFPFIKGFPPVISMESTYQIGRALGRLHSLEIHRQDLDTIRPHDLVGYGGQSILEYTQGENAAPDFVAAFEKIFPNKLQDLPYDLFPAGIIHGDLYFDNSLFFEEKLVTLIDFEQSGTGRFILDIGI